MEEIEYKNELQDLLAKYSVKIKISNDKMGTGFFIGTGKILTCAHVVAGYTDETKIVWNHEEYKISKVVYPRIVNDLAIIYADIENSNFALIGEENISKQTLYSFGYTNDCPEGEPITLEFEGYGSELYAVKKGQIKQGMSGAAVLDISKGVVCGVIKRTKDPNSDLGGRVIPLTHHTLNSFSCVFSEQKNVSTGWGDYLMRWQINEFVSFWKKFMKRPDINKEIFTLFSGYRDRLFEEYVSGSKQIKISDLFKKNLMLEFSGIDEYNHKIINVKSYILDKIQKEKRGIVVCSDPGYGKTTLNYTLFNSLLKLWSGKSDNDIFIPVFIDLSSQEVDDFSLFGTRQWLYKYLENNFYLTNDLVLYLLSQKRLVLIYEGIDEYLSRYTLSEIRSIFDREIFKIGINIFSCRLYNYNGYLRSIKVVNKLNKVELFRLDDLKIKKYLQAFFDFSDISDEKKKQITNLLLDSSSSLYELAYTPLHLNMLLDLMQKDVILEGIVFNIRLLYEIYITEWLNSEESKYYFESAGINYDRIIQILERISWEFFEESQLGKEEFISFTRDRLQILLQQIPFIKDAPNLLEKIIHSTFLVEKRRFNRSNLRFIHKSFQEYFIASYIFHVMTENAVLLGELMQTYITSPVVSEFLRQYLQESEEDIVTRRSIAENCINAYKNNMCTSGDLNTIRKRIAREQLAYHMGIINVKESNSFLIKMSYEEKDVWVKRGIVFGLSYSDIDEYREMYVNILRKERELGQSSIENDCNIGYSLSFYGDQPFDVQHPDLDIKGNSCSNMIDRMQYLLNSESDLPGWRLHLYTIIDIYNHRSNLREDLFASLNRYFDNYSRIVQHLQNDIRCCQWPEIGELSDILTQVKMKFYDV